MNIINDSSCICTQLNEHNKQVKLSMDASVVIKLTHGSLKCKFAEYAGSVYYITITTDQQCKHKLGVEFR